MCDVMAKHLPVNNRSRSRKTSGGRGKSRGLATSATLKCSTCFLGDKLGFGLLFLVVVFFLAGTSLAQQPAAPTEDEAVKVFSLNNASSHHLLDILNTLFEDETSGLAADGETNTVVVKAKPDVLKALEAVLVQLDQRPPNGLRPNPPQAPSVPPPTPAREVAGPVPVRDAIRIVSEARGATTVRSLVHDGAAVRKGDLLVELDDSQLTDDANELLIRNAEIKNGEIPAARRHYETIEAEDLSVLEAGLHVTLLRRKHFEAEAEFELMAAERQIELAQLAVKYAKVHIHRLNEGQKDVKTSLDADMALAKTEAEVELATAKKKLLEEHTKPLRLAEFQLEEVQAKSELAKARIEQHLAREQAKAELSALDQQLKLNVSRMTRIEEFRAKCKIYAPSDGVVRYPTATGPANSLIAVGRQVREGQTILLLYPVD